MQWEKYVMKFWLVQTAKQGNVLENIRRKDTTKHVYEVYFFWYWANFLNTQLLHFIQCNSNLKLAQLWIKRKKIGDKREIFYYIICRLCHSTACKRVIFESNKLILIFFRAKLFDTYSLLRDYFVSLYHFKKENTFYWAHSTYTERERKYGNIKIIYENGNINFN